MFAYCGNNPVNKADAKGTVWGWIVGLGIVVSLILSGCSSTSDEEVLVVSSNEWMKSSQKMERDLSKAVRTGTSSTVAVSNKESFADCWNTTTASYLAIHTHGLPTCISDNVDFTLSVNDSDLLERNSNINYVIITACKVGGPVSDGYNMGQMLSTKISSTGYVICATTTVSGTDSYFYPENGGKWVIYQNGELVDSTISAKITMASIIKYINGQLK